MLEDILKCKCLENDLHSLWVNPKELSFSNLLDDLQTQGAIVSLYPHCPSPHTHNNTQREQELPNERINS